MVENPIILSGTVGDGTQAAKDDGPQVTIRVAVDGRQEADREEDAARPEEAVLLALEEDDLFCSHCNDEGHWVDTCWELLGYPSTHPKAKLAQPKSANNISMTPVDA
ncbi:conserved hypothetical protein [Ricinus communis]|uniref:Uncharacterized protein n=1 Tax=Ricinus communis TaxID=3988 RepID=B9RBY0_RICCO|nr:conserved hypothetical protein [Ricinus communis]